MMISRNTKVENKYIILYIVPLTIVFLSSLASLYGFRNSIINLFLNIRGLTVIIISLLGYCFVRKGKCSKLSVVALSFSSYMMLITVVSNSANLFIALSTIFFWSVTLWLAEKSTFNIDTYKMIALIIGIACNLMSILYVFAWNSGMLLNLENSQAVGAINSIYLVLSLFPFIFLINNRKLQLFLFIFPLLAFFVSSKSTCLVASLLSIFYYFRLQIFSKRNNIKFVITVIFLIIVISWFFSHFIDLNEIFKSFNDDIDSGGNGRLDHFNHVLTFFLNKNIAEQFLGSGLMAVAFDTHLSAHNDFLEILYDYGIIGLTIYFLFWKQLFAKIKYLKCDKQVHSAYIVSLIVYFTVCCTSNFIISQIQMLFFSLFWGTISKYINHKQIS